MSAPAASADSRSRDATTRDTLVFVALATLLGAALRLPQLPHDFWLDEVWSWSLTSQLSGFAGVFRDIHHSNNHHLVSLWMLALGSEAPAWAYRLPSYLAGVATIPLAAMLAWRSGPRAASLAAFLTMASFPLIHFSSEARGYALAVALALGGQLWLQRALARRADLAALGFGACVSLGLLSHLGFAFYWAGACAQALWALRRADPRARLRSLAVLNALPAATLAALYAVDLRHLVVGGGDPTDPLALVTRTFGFGFGAPLTPWAALPTAAVVCAAFAAALARRRRRDDGRWLGDLVTVVVAPVLVFAVARPEVIAVRYFLIGITLVGIALSEWIAEIGSQRGWKAVAAWLGVGAFVIGNALHTVAFLELGRGGYRDAVLAIARDAAAGRPARVSSDHDFRTGSVLRFHARSDDVRDRILYVPQDRAQREGVDWWILHRGSRPARARGEIRDAAGRRFTLVAELDHAAISGFYWALYRAAADRSSTTTPKPSSPKGSAPKR